MVDASLILLIFLSGITGGFVVALSTFAVEKWGGLKGGIIGTIPSTTLVSSIGLALAASKSTFQHSMFAAPIGGFITTITLFTFKTISNRMNSGGLKQLFFRLGLTIACWLCLATAIVFLLPVVSKTIDVRWIGIFFLVLNFIIGVINTCVLVTPATPAAKLLPSWKIYVVRGIVGMVAIVITVTVGKLNAGIGALLSVFPVVVLTNITFLSISQPSSLVLGALGPMILGGLSPSLYNYILGNVYTSLSLAPSVVIALATSVFGYSIPVGIILWYRKNRTWRKVPQADQGQPMTERNTEVVDREEVPPEQIVNEDHENKETTP